MKKRSKTKTILIGLLVLFIAVQAIQPTKNKGSLSGPKDIQQTMHVPDSVFAVLKRSCYDCHSDSTKYPWYDNITPANWFVANHVNGGKRHLNFTSFGEYDAKKQSKKIDGIAETVEKGEMPLSSYLILHPDAKLSEAEKNMLIAWAKNQ